MARVFEPVRQCYRAISISSISFLSKSLILNPAVTPYTLHEHLDELGIIHMNGRIFDPLMARFMSADPFIQAPINLQSHNRYAYVMNNPLIYSDPSGYFSLKGNHPLEPTG